jgi:hypothetical protein
MQVVGLNVAPIISHLYPEITLATLATNKINLSFDVRPPIILLGYLDIQSVATTRLVSPQNGDV